MLRYSLSLSFKVIKTGTKENPVCDFLIVFNWVPADLGYENWYKKTTSPWATWWWKLNDPTVISFDSLPADTSPIAKSRSGIAECEQYDEATFKTTSILNPLYDIRTKTDTTIKSCTQAQHGKVKPVFVSGSSSILSVTCGLSSEPLPTFASFQNQFLLAVSNIRIWKVTKNK